MGSFEKRVLTYIRAHRLWQPGDAVSIAVSGGLDSTVLMHVLSRTQRGSRRLFICAHL